MVLPSGTIERWAHDYVVSDVLATKLAPPRPPTAVCEGLPTLRIEAPGRPPELVPTDRAKRPRSLRDPRKRAALLHTFFHHELQAAELMCWAVLAFPETPAAFKRGLVAIAGDEIRHMNLYAEHIARLGCAIGDFPVRDWFWSRIPRVSSASEFVATMGIGFEGGNLDHTRRFAAAFREVGDDEGAALQELVAREEIAHVAFASHWFRELEGELSFERWTRALPEPLSPLLMRGDPLDRDARRAGGFDDAFLDALSRWPCAPDPSGAALGSESDRADRGSAREGRE